MAQGAGLQFPEQVLLTHLASKVVNHLAKYKPGALQRDCPCWTPSCLFPPLLVQGGGEVRGGRMCSGRLDLKQVADLSAGTRRGCLHICVKSICPLDIRASPVKRCDSLHLSFPWNIKFASNSSFGVSLWVTKYEFSISVSWLIEILFRHKISKSTYAT